MKVLLLLAALAAPAAAREVPYLTARVVDEADLLDSGAEARLEALLKDYESRSGRQFAVLTVPSLEGEPLEDYTIKVARTWKLGRAGKDDGLLLFVSRDDRKMRLEVGYGLEGQVPDALAGRIVRGELAPRFRAGDFAGGIEAGARAAIAAVEGGYSPAPDAGAGPGSGSGRGDIADMHLAERLLVSAFVFGILGLFEAVGIAAPGVGWFLYFFLIPFWASFPMAIWGWKFGSIALGAHLLGFPIAKLLLTRTSWGKRMRDGMTGSGRGGGFGGGFGGGGWSSGGGGWSSGGGGGFSGGGGSFGGGGASGSW